MPEMPILTKMLEEPQVFPRLKSQTIALDILSQFSRSLKEKGRRLERWKKIRYILKIPICLEPYNIGVKKNNKTNTSHSFDLLKGFFPNLPSTSTQPTHLGGFKPLIGIFTIGSNASISDDETQWEFSFPVLLSLIVVTSFWLWLLIIFVWLWRHSLVWIRGN